MSFSVVCEHGMNVQAPMDGIFLWTWEPQAPRGTLPEPSGKTASELFRHKQESDENSATGGLSADSMLCMLLI